MANSYNNPNFEIDTSCNVADLIVLKGGAIATTDWIYLFDNATLTAEQNLGILSFYFGDNVAGTAGTKTGHLIINNNVTITLYHATTHYGLRGEGSTSTITSSGSGSKITCNTLHVVTNYYMNLCKIDFSAGGEFEHLYGLFWGNADSDYRNVIFRHCLYTFYIINTIQTLPKSIDGAEFIGCTASIYDITTTTPVEWGDFLVVNEIKCTATVDGFSQFNFRFGGAGATRKYLRAETSTNSLKNKYRKGLKGVFGIKNRN